MILKLRHAPLTVKTALIALAILAGAAGACIGVWLYLNAGDGASQAPWRVRRAVHSFLKKQSGHGSFEAQYEFDLAEKLAQMRADLTLLRTNNVLVQSNLTSLQRDIRTQTSESQTLAEQERGARAALVTATNDLTDRQRRFAARSAEFTLAQSNVWRTETNLVLSQQETATLQSSSQNLSNQIQTLQGRLGELQTNVTAAQSNLTALQIETKAKTRELTAKKRFFTDAKRDLEAKQQRLLAKTNDTNLDIAVSTLQTNVAGLQSETATIQGSLTNLETQVTVRQQELAALQKELAGVQKDLGARGQEFGTVRRTLATKQAELATRQSHLRSLQGVCGTAQTNVTLTQSHLMASEANLKVRRETLAARQKELGEKKAGLEARQKELAALQADLGSKQKQAQELQKTISAKDQELADQQGYFVRDIRKQVAAAGSYEVIYKAIGQELWVAEKLLESGDTNKQRAALNLAVDSSQHALAAAENAWLAARICEGYLWPNLPIADLPAKPGQNTDQLLQLCAGVFQKAEEYPQLIQNYRLMLNYVTNEPRADSLRYTLAYTLEVASNYDEALQWYRQVKTTNYSKLADERMLITQDKRRAALEEKKKPAKPAPSE